jgi:hypothetical protein
LLWHLSKNMLKYLKAPIDMPARQVQIFHSQ